MKRTREVSVGLDDDDQDDEPKPKRQKVNHDEKSRHWFLTWNNHTETSIDDLLGIPSLVKYQIQEEMGEEGTVHLQGVMCFKNEKSWTTLRQVAEIYWKPCRNLQAARNYCSKVETAYGESWSRGFKKLSKVIDPMDGKTMYEWQQNLEKYCTDPIKDREIMWIWSDEGNRGKSSMVKHLVLKNKAYVFGGKMGDAKYGVAQLIEKGIEPELIIFDVPRAQGNKLSYNALEKLKDGCFYSGKYESVMVVYNTPRVIVMANMEPDREKMSGDRWEIINIDTEEWKTAHPVWRD